MNTFGYTVKTDHCPLLDCLSKVTQLTESSLLHGQHCNYSQAHSQTQQPSTAPAGAWGWSIQKLFQITGLHGHTSRRQSCAQNGYECMAMNGHEWPWMAMNCMDIVMTHYDHPQKQLTWLNWISSIFMSFNWGCKLQSCKAAKLQSCKAAKSTPVQNCFATTTPILIAALQKQSPGSWVAQSWDLQLRGQKLWSTSDCLTWKPEFVDQVGQAQLPPRTLRNNFGQSTITPSRLSPNLASWTPKQTGSRLHIPQRCEIKWVT